MAILGAHRVSAGRSYSVHRNSGLLTIFGTFAFAGAIFTTEGAVVATLGWQPFLAWTNGWVWVGAPLMASAILGVAGLAFEDDDKHRFPRICTLLSALIGATWFVVAAVGFTVAWKNGYPNAGLFLAAPGAILHWNRFWLLNEWPR